MTSDKQNSKPVKSWFIGPMSRIGLIWAFAAFILDQVHKTWMLNVVGMVEGDRFSLTPFLDIVLIWNRGVSYRMFQQETTLGRLILAGFSIIAIIALFIWLARGDHTRLAGIALGLVAGGAAGNALDRLIRPGVADFFSLHAYGFNWYIFNIADVAIVAGVAVLLYDSLIVSPKTASNQSQD
jgi:signal peptidase II